MVRIAEEGGCLIGDTVLKCLLIRQHGGYFHWCPDVHGNRNFAYSIVIQIWPRAVDRMQLPILFLIKESQYIGSMHVGLSR